MLEAGGGRRRIDARGPGGREGGREEGGGKRRIEARGGGEGEGGLMLEAGRGGGAGGEKED